ncbi:MAG: hypothetical protein H6741_04240 [Alphaproteobacteria bacterium]|nr:hypothetical protein [Alphaproteobacteria bacterium]
MLLLLQALLLSLPAAAAGLDGDGAQTSPAPVPVEPGLPAPEQRLEEAVDAYIRGELVQARDMLIQLVTDPDVDDPKLLQEARLWLGEIQYNLNELQAAEKTFQTVLLHDPELRLDPYRYPPDVIAFFDAVRAALEAQRPPDVVDPVRPPPPRAPPSVAAYLAPGGLQFYNKQPGLGALTLTAVGGLGATSLGMRIWLLSRDIDPDTPGVQIEVPVEDVDDLQVRLNAYQALENSAGFLAIGIWGATTLGGALRAQRDLEAGAAELQVGPGSASLTIRF